MADDICDTINDLLPHRMFSVGGNHELIKLENFKVKTIETNRHRGWCARDWKRGFDEPTYSDQLTLSDGIVPQVFAYVSMADMSTVDLLVSAFVAEEIDRADRHYFGRAFVLID